MSGFWYQRGAERIWLPSPEPDRRAFWEAEVRRLFLAGKFDIDEFERLLDVALRGEQPTHPDLPLFVPPL